MNEDESLERFGLSPDPKDLLEIRRILASQTDAERARQGAGDTELMRLCCVQLFNTGDLSDVLSIWRAKAASMDSSISIEIQLLCGSGLQETLDYLAKDQSEEARRAVERILECRDSGDFEDFSVSNQAAMYVYYYT